MDNDFFKTHDTTGIQERGVNPMNERPQNQQHFENDITSVEHVEQSPHEDRIQTLTREASIRTVFNLQPNEVFLFHGTKLANIPDILHKGFKLIKARKGLYGKGIYLAESSEKADQYAGKYTYGRNRLNLIVPTMEFDRMLLTLPLGFPLCNILSF